MGGCNVGVFLCVMVVVTVLWVVTPKKLPDFPYPWCGATSRAGYYRCHRPVGHEGSHLCDDPTGVVEWSDPEGDRE